MSTETQEIDKKNKSDAAREKLSPFDLRTANEIVVKVTADYISEVQQRFANGEELTFFDIESQLLRKTNAAISVRNLMVEKGENVPLLRDNLTIYQVAELASHFGGFVNIATSISATPSNDMLAIYDAHRGIYTSALPALQGGVRRIAPTLSSRAVGEVLEQLQDRARRVVESSDPDLVPMNNGVFNYGKKELVPYGPELVFTAKCAVDYVAGKKHPDLSGPDGERFNFHEWLFDLMSDDEETFWLVWRVIGAVLRGSVSWDKAVFFYDTKGSNGKGTLAEMLRNLIGPENAHSLPIVDFSRDFMLEPLTRAYAVITDENDVGGFIDRSGNLKTAITHEPLMINRKGRSPISYAFKGMMIQCVNELPAGKDKTSSLARRFLFIPFEKTFVGKEKKWIKSEMMSNKDLLEYIAYFALRILPDYYDLGTSKRARELLQEYRIENEPVLDFWVEFKDQFAWDFLPNAFLYDLFKAWFQETNPSGRVLGRNKFLAQLEGIVDREGSEWQWTDSPQRPGGRMSSPEYLIKDFSLENWKNHDYFGRDDDYVCTPTLKASYRGLARK
ncbi:DNA primase family protein [Actinomyces minihominis]|uniref:DNA primase family protein n=1 Tax=Actinomyces minihominis TaxID=2002838 RepID=UPI000C08542D|nr:phage/plasmid primase, P4 family [Actinomyces minihominis]